MIRTEFPFSTGGGRLFIALFCPRCLEILVFPTSGGGGGDLESKMDRGPEARAATLLSHVTVLQNSGTTTVMMNMRMFRFIRGYCIATHELWFNIVLLFRDERKALSPFCLLGRAARIIPAMCMCGSRNRFVRELPCRNSPEQGFLVGELLGNTTQDVRLCSRLEH